jgi:hypothetical protein
MLLPPGSRDHFVELVLRQFANAVMALAVRPRTKQESDETHDTLPRATLGPGCKTFTR